MDGIELGCISIALLLIGWNIESIRQTSWYTCKMAYYDDCYNCCNSTYTVYFIKSNGWN